MTPESIRQWRVAHRMTQREMAVALGLDGPRTDRTIQDWEAGRRTPPAFLEMALRWIDVTLTSTEAAG